MTRAAVLGGETIDVVVSHSRRHLNGVQIRDVADFIGSTAPPPPGPHIPPGAYFLDCCLGKRSARCCELSRDWRDSGAGNHGRWHFGLLSMKTRSGVAHQFSAGMRKI